MSEDILDYYEMELSFLRRAGAEFARRYPQVASRLQLEANKCDDPHVERLLEGMAFLAGRIHRRLDDDAPELSEALLSVAYPQYVRPVPSMALVQMHLDPDQGQLTSGLEVPAGTALFSRPVDGVPCRFRTGYDTTLWPLKVESAGWVPPQGLGLRASRGVVGGVKLRVVSTGAPVGSLNLERLRFYLHGDGSLALSVVRTAAVVVRRGGAAARREPRRGSTAGSARAGRLRNRRGVAAPPPSLVPALPVSAGVLRVSGEVPLSRPVRARGRAGRSLGKRVRGRDPDPVVRAARTGSGSSRTGSTPTSFVSGVRRSSICSRRPRNPCLLSHRQHEYPVVADARRRASTRIYSVEGVQPVMGGGRSPVIFEPLHGRVGLPGAADEDRVLWYARRRDARIHVGPGVRRRDHVCRFERPDGAARSRRGDGRSGLLQRQLAEPAPLRRRAGRLRDGREWAARADRHGGEADGPCVVAPGPGPDVEAHLPTRRQLRVAGRRRAGGATWASAVAQRHGPTRERGADPGSRRHRRNAGTCAHRRRTWADLRAGKQGRDPSSTKRRSRGAERISSPASWTGSSGCRCRSTASARSARRPSNEKPRWVAGRLGPDGRSCCEPRHRAGVGRSGLGHGPPAGRAPPRGAAPRPHAGRRSRRSGSRGAAVLRAPVVRVPARRHPWARGARRRPRPPDRQSVRADRSGRRAPACLHRTGRSPGARRQSRATRLLRPVPASVPLAARTGVAEDRHRGVAGDGEGPSRIAWRGISSTSSDVPFDQGPAGGVDPEDVAPFSALFRAPSVVAPSRSNCWSRGDSECPWPSSPSWAGGFDSPTTTSVNWDPTPTRRASVGARWWETRFWDPHARVRVRLGPLDRATFESFLPGGAHHENLRDLCRFFVHDQFVVEACLVLERNDVPDCVVSDDGDGPALGWSTWLRTRPLQRDPDETLLTL